MKWVAFLTLQLLSASAYSHSYKLVPSLSNIPSSIRGLSVVDDRVVWFSGSKGYVGRSTDGAKTWRVSQVKDFESVDFRSLYAFDSLHAIIANAGSPGNILKTTDGGRTWRTVYQNNHPDIFFDGIDFWDERSGMIYGDPIAGKMMLLKTNDSGETWTEVPPDQRPPLKEGEASFAASGTGIRCYEKNKVIIATGGNVSRLWVSSDKGEHWNAITSPIIQGKNSAGIFSVTVNQKIWITVGGDYVADSISTKNSFYSLDEGKTWTAPIQPTRGYRSGVEFIIGKTWIATGQRGVDISTDNGKNWTALSDEKGFHVIRKARKGSLIVAAGNGKVAIVTPDI
jgi:photosystem II stability/assembly factor-like uncharacterized protein